jgi:hypothetical protein
VIIARDPAAKRPELRTDQDGHADRYHHPHAPFQEQLLCEESRQRFPEFRGRFGGEMIAGHFGMPPVQSVRERTRGLVLPVFRAGQNK